MLHIRVVTTPGLTGQLLDRLADLPGAGPSARTANRPAKPPPTITTRRAPDPVVMSSPRRVVPGVVGRQQPVASAVFSSPQREEAAKARRDEHAVMTMRRRSLRALQRMERDLASSDPGLDALFQSFARRTRGWDMSWVEEVGRKRFLLFGRRRRVRKLTERMKDWTAENWKDP